MKRRIWSILLALVLTACAVPELVLQVSAGDGNDSKSTAYYISNNSTISSTIGGSDVSYSNGNYIYSSKDGIAG